jgi:SAM-dependent methyltransferase
MSRAVFRRITSKLKGIAQGALRLHPLTAQVEFIKGQVAELNSKLGSQLQNNISMLKPADDFVLLEPASKQTGQRISTRFDEFDPAPDLEALAAQDTRPLPITEDREGYHGDRHFDYWLSGLRDYLLIRHLSRKYELDLPKPERIFDFGCASGRVIRQFSAHEKGLELWGMDINIRHTEWVRRHLDPSIKVFQGTILPILPLRDEYFSLVYAFSVFSHIDYLETAWLLELQRILRPGGVAYLSIHSEGTWNRMREGVPIYDALINGASVIEEYKVTPEFLAAPMPKEKTVFTYRTGMSYNTNVFLHTDYIRNSWGRYFEIVDIVPEGHNYQDVVLLRKWRG